MNRKTCAVVLFVFLLFAAIGFTGCKRGPAYDVDVSGIDIEPVQINRYEKVLFDINPYNLREEIDPYIDDYKFFLGDEIDNPMAQQQLIDYITDPFIMDLYHETTGVFPVLDGLEDELTKAFRYYKYYFPGKDVPDVYTYVSGLDLSDPVKYGGDDIAIALDLYLGSDFSLYSRVGVPAYQLMRRSPEFIIRDVMYAVAEGMIYENYRPESLLDKMVYEGIKHYFLDCMMPNYHDTLKMAYTSNQELWIKHNQGHVWSYFLDNELLFSTNHNKINNFIIDAPFTSPFTRNSSPRVGVWLGWQMVREYMRRNPGVELSELINETDSEMVLNKSRYKP